MPRQDTTTQILERIDERLRGCPADDTTYKEHCEILSQLKVTLPKIDETLEKINKRLDAHYKDILIMQTQRKTERGVLSVIAGVVGALAGWFGRNL